ncbi:MAG: RnfABCDGE type electron transport complex subunit D [Candidatus Omnitrophota bacterium]
MINFKSIKVQINSFLAVFAVFLYLKEPRIAFLTGFFWAILFSVLIEALWLFLKTKKLRATDGILTSGLIIGYVLSAESPWWMFLAAAAFTVGVKRLLRFHGKNLLNPAAAGLFLAAFLLEGSIEWKGAYTWYFLFPAGLYIIYKIKKTEIVLGYFMMSLALFIPQALIQGSSLLNIPWYFNYFFIFIMLIEPKTTPPTRWPKIAFGAGVALLIFLLTEWGFQYEPELFALLVVNALVPFLNKIPDFKFKPIQKTSQEMPMKNRKITLFLCGLLIASTTAFAHPPSDIKIQFDPATKLLTAVIEHHVSNPQTHYIKKVDIGLNGKEIKMLPFKKQDDNTTQTVEIMIPEAKKGDTLSVEGYCNLSGKLKKEIKVA